MILSTVKSNMDIDHSYEHPASTRGSATTCWIREPPISDHQSTQCNQCSQYNKGHHIPRLRTPQSQCLVCHQNHSASPNKYQHRKHGVSSPFFRFISHCYRCSGRRRAVGLCCNIDGYKFSTVSTQGCVDATNGCVSYPPSYVGGVPSYRPIRWFSQLQLCVFYLVLVVLLCSADGCSSRSTPKPRPPSPTMRPNITFQTYACPPAYAAWYCLNGATCFTVKIGISILYNCECADGFMGQRCEFKDLDGSYLQYGSGNKNINERWNKGIASRDALRMSIVSSAGSSVAGGVLVVVAGVAILAIVLTTRRNRARQLQHLRYIQSENGHNIIGNDINMNSMKHGENKERVFNNRSPVSSVDVMERTISFRLERQCDCSHSPLKTEDHTVPQFEESMHKEENKRW